MALLSFTVPTGDVCVLCLKKCPSNSNPGGSAAGYTSFQAISQYLDLDIREIFNIKRELPTGGGGVGGGDEDGGGGVNVDVMMCKSCGVWRNNFCQMYGELRNIQRKLDQSVRGMHELMVTSERNVGNVKGYLKVIVEGTKSLAKVKGSIPEKFRKEAIAKSSRKGLVKAEEAPEDEKDGEVDFYCKEKVANSDAEEEDDGEYDQFEAEFLMEAAGEAEGVNMKEISASPEDQDPSDDEDPEELMMRYDSMTENENRYSDEEEDPLSAIPGGGDNMEGEDEEIEIFVNTGALAGPSTAGSSSPAGKNPRTHRPGTYGSKFECDLCGKVVVSLKNFELHQRRHAGEKPFECEYCPKTFRDTSNLRSHVLRYHRHFIFLKFKAPDVSIKDFSEGLDSLIQSILTSSTPDENSSTRVAQGCHLCKRFYTQRYAIEDHIVQRHYDVLAISIAQLQKEMNSLTRDECLFYMTQIMAEGNTAKMCGSCGKLFDSGEELNLHVKTHIKVNLVRNKETANMGASSSSGSLIKLKMKCEPCGRYFEDLTALTKHKNTLLSNGGCSYKPSRDALFQCEHCGKCLNTINSKRRHLLSLHRYQVFAKYLPAGSKAVEVEDMIKFIFEVNKPQKGKDGFKCFICSKVITQLRKLSSHVLVSHFNNMVMMVKKGLRERRAGNAVKVAFECETESGTGGAGGPPQLEIFSEGDTTNEPGIELIELDSENESEGAPQILRMIDDNGEEISMEGDVQLESDYVTGGDVEYIVDDEANMVKVKDPDIKIEYGVSYSS